MKAKCFTIVGENWFRFLGWGGHCMEIYGEIWENVK